MVKNISKLESLFASALSALISLIEDLPYTPCIFFFGEPEYPSDEE